MPVTLGHSALQGVLRIHDAIRLLEEMLSHEAAGRTATSPRFCSDFEGGSMRMLFAVDYEAGYGVSKAYHAVEGCGVRSVVTLYRLKDGEVLAFLDGSVITDLRTGAVSGVIARRIALNERVTVGVIGAGHQARMQLESLATVYRIASAAVYSPTYEHCEAFACEMSRKLHLPIKVTESAEAAARDRTVVVAASSARTSDPILHGAWLGACRLLCAVGNTRPQFAEIDVECFSRAALIVADTEHAFQESGELKRAGDAGAVPADKRTILAQLVSGQVKVPRQGLVVFKSVGSALQDLALASRYYELLADSGIPAAADLASARRPVREIRAAVKPTSRKRGPRS